MNSVLSGPEQPDKRRRITRYLMQVGVSMLLELIKESIMPEEYDC